MAGLSAILRALGSTGKSASKKQVAKKVKKLEAKHKKKAGQKKTEKEIAEEKFVKKFKKNIGTGQKKLRARTKGAQRRKAKGVSVKELF